MLFNSIVEILNFIKLGSSEVYMQGEKLDGVKPPFAVVKNASIGADAFIDSSGTMYEESFIISCYGYTPQLAKREASAYADFIQFKNTGNYNIGKVTFLEGSVKLETELYFQDIQFKVVLTH